MALTEIVCDDVEHREWGNVEEEEEKEMTHRHVSSLPPAGRRQRRPPPTSFTFSPTTLSPDPPELPAQPAPPTPDSRLDPLPNPRANGAMDGGGAGDRAVHDASANADQAEDTARQMRELVAALSLGDGGEAATSTSASGGAEDGWGGDRGGNFGDDGDGGSYAPRPDGGAFMGEWGGGSGVCGTFPEDVSSIGSRSALSGHDPHPPRWVPSRPSHSRPFGTPAPSTETEKRVNEYLRAKTEALKALTSRIQYRDVESPDLPSDGAAPGGSTLSIVLEGSAEHPDPEVRRLRKLLTKENGVTTSDLAAFDSAGIAIDWGGATSAQSTSRKSGGDYGGGAEGGGGYNLEADMDMEVDVNIEVTRLLAEVEAAAGSVGGDGDLLDAEAGLDLGSLDPDDDCGWAGAAANGSINRSIREESDAVDAVVERTRRMIEEVAAMTSESNNRGSEPSCDWETSFVSENFREQAVDVDSVVKEETDALDAAMQRTRRMMEEARLTVEEATATTTYGDEGSGSLEHGGSVSLGISTIHGGSRSVVEVTEAVDAVMERTRRMMEEATAMTSASNNGGSGSEFHGEKSSVASTLDDPCGKRESAREVDESADTDMEWTRCIMEKATAMALASNDGGSRSEYHGERLFAASALDDPCSMSGSIREAPESVDMAVDRMWRMVEEATEIESYGGGSGAQCDEDSSLVSGVSGASGSVREDAEAVDAAVERTWRMAEEARAAVAAMESAAAETEDKRGNDESAADEDLTGRSEASGSINTRRGEWFSRWSKMNGREYFYNSETKEVRWDMPDNFCDTTSLREGAEEAMSEEVVLCTGSSTTVAERDDTQIVPREGADPLPPAVEKFPGGGADPLTPVTEEGRLAVVNGNPSDPHFEKIDLAEEGDDDYVPVADFSSGAKIQKSGGGPDDPQFEKIDFVEEEDEDYVPVSDFSRGVTVTQRVSVEPERRQAPESWAEEDRKRRTRLRRWRRRRAAVAVMLVGVAAFVYYIRGGLRLEPERAEGAMEDSGDHRATLDEGELEAPGDNEGNEFKIDDNESESEGAESEDDFRKGMEGINSQVKGRVENHSFSWENDYAGNVEVPNDTEDNSNYGTENFRQHTGLDDNKNLVANTSLCSEHPHNDCVVLDESEVAKKNNKCHSGVLKGAEDVAHNEGSLINENVPDQPQKAIISTSNGSTLDHDNNEAKIEAMVTGIVQRQGKPRKKWSCSFSGECRRRKKAEKNLQSNPGATISISDGSTLKHHNHVAKIISMVTTIVRHREKPRKKRSCLGPLAHLSGDCRRRKKAEKQKHLDEYQPDFLEISDEGSMDTDKDGTAMTVTLE